METKRQIVITKKIAKYGKQFIVVIPRAVENQLKPGTLAKFTIDVLEESRND